MGILDAFKFLLGYKHIWRLALKACWLFLPWLCYREEQESHARGVFLLSELEGLVEITASERWTAGVTNAGICRTKLPASDDDELVTYF
jgi:hypothetical protein